MGTGGTYRTDPASDAQVTAVETGDGRHFLVIQFRIREWKTLVFQHEMAPDSWLSRREIHQNVEPVPALTGLLLGPREMPHPIEVLKKRLSLEQRANWDLRNELRRVNARLTEKVKRKKGRGKRVSRNP